MYLRLKVTTVSIYHHNVWKKSHFYEICQHFVIFCFEEFSWDMFQNVSKIGIFGSFLARKFKYLDFLVWDIFDGFQAIFVNFFPLLVGHDKKVFYWLIFLVSEYNIAHCNPSTKEFVATILYFLFVFKSIFRQALANLFMLNSQNRTRLLTSKFPW